MKNIADHKMVSILLVEDDDVDAIAVERAFNKLRICNPLHRVADGVEALSALKSGAINKPFIVLLDLNLPRMNGHEFLQKLRDDPELTKTVVFVLTTSKAEKDKYEAYEHHVAGYIVKDKFSDGFEALIDLLEHYWRLIELPED
jgi:CheY-like chemotaxis protein